MAWPFLSYKNWETGDASEWDSETDTDSIGNVRHYTDLVRLTRGCVPYSGAYAYHVALAGGTNPANCTETDDFDTSADGTIYVGFAFWVGNNLTMANNDAFSLFTLDSAGPVIEVDLGIVQTSDVQYFRGGDGSTYRTTPLTKNKWYWAEVAAHIDNAGGDDGTIDVYLNGSQVGAQITGVDQGAITQARYGVVGPDAGTSGDVVLGPIAADNGRIGYYFPRYCPNPMVLKTGHIFVGPGTLSGAAITSTGATDTLSLYDTDTAYTTAGQMKVADLNGSAQSSVGGPLVFQRGCYAVLTGTNATGQVYMDLGDNEFRGFPKSFCYNDAGLRRYALEGRKARPANI